ncbi:TPA: hypothetical protein PPN73_000483 [Serratia rubidaea]|nr:hypothetical protein [Serratia rubidaea]
MSAYDHSSLLMPRLLHETLRDDGGFRTLTCALLTRDYCAGGGVFLNQSQSRTMLNTPDAFFTARDGAARREV